MSRRRTQRFHSDESAALDVLSKLVLPLDVIRRRDLALAGGKGANLGELTGAGYPVPGGFVVTTVAYDKFVEHSNLDKIISQVLLDQRENGAAIQEAFERAPIPSELEHAIKAAYQLLGQGPVAVRSSATAEDLPEAAFAGQQDTYLNVIGPEDVLSAVRHCFASLWTDRAIAYRKRQGIDQQSVKLAVVVQHMIPSEAAGVMFTANPVTGARDEIVIDATPGLGEALVSGLVTPDHLVLRRRRWRGWHILEQNRGRHEVIIRSRAEGGTEYVSPEQVDPVWPQLSDREALHLARLGAAIQHHFRYPQDIEWALADGKLFILQARPMTALPEPPPRAGRITRMVAPIAAEIFPVRPYPLDATTWAPSLFNEALALFRLIGISVPPLSHLFIIEDGVVVRFSQLPLRPTLAILSLPYRLISTSRRYDPEHWQDDPDLKKALERVHALEQRNLKVLSWKELLSTAHEALELARPLAGEPRLRYFPRGILAMARLRLLLALVKRGKDFGSLLSGIETKTTETNRALEALAARIRSDSVLSNIFSTYDTTQLWAALDDERPSVQNFLAELQLFLDHYGHREASPALVSLPTWKDAPETVLGILKGLAGAPPTRTEESRPAWEVKQDELLAHPLLGLPLLRSAFVKSLLQARRFLQVREDTHFYGTMPMTVLRRIFLELGQRLVTAGALGNPEEVFYLTLAELEQIEGTWPPHLSLINDLRLLVQRRKTRRAALKDVPLIDPRLFRNIEKGTGVLLRGVPGSPGLAEGPVRIIRDGSEFGKLRPGEVLVAPYTNPSWTPLFQRAIAVIVDSGGAGSHAAIVAREYGIPAVMATIDGTRRLTNGERVKVDGSRGLVLQVIEHSADHHTEFRGSKSLSGESKRTRGDLG